MTSMRIAALVLAVSTSTLAQAETMTFPGLPTSVSGPATYTEDNITVTSASGSFWAWPSAGQLHMDPGGFAGPTFTFTYGGGLFTPTSIDISYTSSGTLTFTGFDAMNVALGSLIFTAPTGTLDLSALGLLSSLQMTDSVEHISVDNFVIAAAGVPEPAGWAMMIAGIGAIGATMRRRRGRTTVTYA